MSLKSCFPRICELEQQYGGLLKAMMLLAKKKRAEVKAGKSVASAAGPAGILTSFVGGIEELTNATAAALSTAVLTHAAVTALRRQSDGFELTLADGSKVSTEMVIFAAPAHALAGITADFDGEMSTILRQILYAPMNVICSGYEREKITRNLDAFGYLIAKKEGRATLGTLWDSSIFPNRAPQGKVLLRSMMGGATNPGAIELSDSEVLDKVRVDLQQIMGITAPPDFVRIFRHPQAIPQYTAGHSRRVEALRARAALAPGLFFTGNAFFGVGLNDCVNASNLVADEVLAFLKA
jgi:oxygen-dependent protoporphyrinogen oxidase